MKIFIIYGQKVTVWRGIGYNLMLNLSWMSVGYYINDLHLAQPSKISFSASQMCARHPWQLPSSFRTKPSLHYYSNHSVGHLACQATSTHPFLVWAQWHSSPTPRVYTNCTHFMFSQCVARCKKKKNFVWQRRTWIFSTAREIIG